jgi:ketosteroid isomerase-like protein
MARRDFGRPGDVVRMGYNSLRTGDLPGLLACIAEDVVIDRPALLAWGKVQRGRDYFAQVIGRMVSCADFEITASDIFEGEVDVVGTLAYTLTAHTTGEKLDIKIVEIFSIEAGLITRIDVYDKDPSAIAAFLDRAEAGAILGPI